MNQQMLSFTNCRLRVYFKPHYPQTGSHDSIYSATDLVKFRGSGDVMHDEQWLVKSLAQAANRTLIFGTKDRNISSLHSERRIITVRNQEVCWKCKFCNNNMYLLRFVSLNTRPDCLCEAPPLFWETTFEFWFWFMVQRTVMYCLYTEKIVYRLDVLQ